ncbi:MAG: hypothetical protein FWF23_02110 [Alphaproteobacteria bacterium]|nr:hypothetical protein [Alphaproteobacteria bacterium]MCL2504735.1 hypothetical protein [Alphaproteobacteria bacterium]
MMNRNIKSNSGIAIGSILFLILLLGILTVAFASTSGNFGAALSSDRVVNEIYTQANLIRNTIAKCKAEFEMRRNISSFGIKQICPKPLGGGYPLSFDGSNLNPVSVDKLVCSPLAQAVKNADGECGFFADNAFVSDGDRNLSVIGTSVWASGIGDIVHPMPIPGFSEWQYVNDISNGGGVCFWIAPVNPDHTNQAFSEGLQRVAERFRWSGSVSEGIENYSEVILSDPYLEGSSQKFIVWLVPPVDIFRVNAGCAP